MTSEKLEYDSSSLPEYIKSYEYAADHIKEIRDLLHSTRNPPNKKLIFQTIPKHMRRRAMSHNPKRLPRKYRNIHISQMAKAGKPQKNKRPSRKYRRKPVNLMKEYVRRQRKYVWLETHIWHAKRFHMINRWGYRLPYASCDKTYRACYRASVKHCLLQDISFYGCIEIKGPVDDIKCGFDHLTSTKCGLSITAKSYTSGKREGSIHLFKADCYPRDALTKVNFIWKPSESILEVSRTVWIFIHPSAYKEVLEEIVKVFELASTKISKSRIPEEDSSSKETDAKFSTKISAYVRNPRYVSDKTDVSLVELKDTLNRFRLTGSLSQSVLSHAFKCKSIADMKSENSFKNYIQSDEDISHHKSQMDYWKKISGISSPGELVPNIVVGLNIEDPRINRPSKRRKAIPDDEVDNSVCYELPENVCLSSIWDYDVREELLKNMMSNHDYYSMRNKNVAVPGERCKFENELQPIPVLLIQRPGSQNNSYKRLGYGAGWDVIIPSGYGMCVWLSLIAWGAKPGGLRELNSVSRESGQDEFLPDSVSGRKCSFEKYIELREKYFRLPPNKRCNYNKFAIASPFRAPFQKLIDEWRLENNEGDTFYVLREREILEKIINAVKKKCEFPNIENSLIQVSIKMKTRGNSGNFSIICLPKRCDVKRLYKRIYFKDHNVVYTEPIGKDKNESERKRLRMEHKKLLKRLRAKRVREKKKLKETSEIKVKIQPTQTGHLVTKHFKEMCELWLKENPENIKDQCSREVFGYMTESEFSFVESTVGGIGYVSSNGLKKLISLFEKGEIMVLVRGTKTRNYRFASIKVNPIV